MIDYSCVQIRMLQINLQMHSPTERAISKRRGAYLPHWTADEAWYAITVRLWDSLPQSVLNSWLFERKNIVKTAEQMNRPLSKHEEDRLAYLYSQRVEGYLDAGYGDCYMNNDRVAEVVATAICYFDMERYELAAWCVMPNHAHVVIRAVAPYQLSDILHSWKSFSAKEANRILNRSGSFWQSEYYDHLIRDAADYAHCVNYVLANPAMAGLKNWKWVGRPALVDDKNTRKMRVPQ